MKEQLAIRKTKTKEKKGYFHYRIAHSLLAQEEIARGGQWQCNKGTPGYNIFL